MTDDWRVVFDCRNHAACADRALVLEAAGIPHERVYDQGGWALIVPAEFSSHAMVQLRLYDDENPPDIPEPRPAIPSYNAVPGVIGYITVVLLVGWLHGHGAFGENWLAAGRVDGVGIRNGEWWRLFTALTLHSGPSHLVGNIVFGMVFGLFAGRLLGSGVAWFAIVMSAGMGNLLNTLLLESTHRAIGASTAVFAALGMLAGFVWRARLMSQARWPYRVGPIVGGLALLMFTGTGDENTDIGAHFMGFVSGFAAGLILVRFRSAMKDRKKQVIFGAAAAGILAVAWIAGLAGSNPPPIM